MISNRLVTRKPLSAGGSMRVNRPCDIKPNTRAHFQRAYHLAGNHPPPMGLLIDLTLDYSESIIAVEGYGSSRARDLLDKVLSLAEQRHEKHAQFRALNGIWLGQAAARPLPKKACEPLSACFKWLRTSNRGLPHILHSACRPSGGSLRCPRRTPAIRRV